MLPEEKSGPELRDYLSVLRRRKWTIALTVVVLVGLSLVNSFLTTPIYQGTATVLLQPRSTDTLFNPSTGARNDPARAVDTEIQVLKSEPVRAMVRQQLGSAPPVSASGVGQTDVINVSTTSTKPAVAAKTANAYANAYIDFRRKQAVDDLLAASQEIQGKVDDLQKQIDALDARINSTSDPVQQNAIRQNVGPQKDQLVTQQGTFKQRLDQLQVETGLTTGRAQLVTPAGVPSSPVKPTPLRSGILALVVGLVLGIGLAFLRDHLDDSIKTKDDLDRAAGGLAVIGVIPAVAEWKDKATPRVVSLADSRSAATEAYRTLRTSIQFLGLNRPLRALQITSPGAQEGKSTTIANLAVALAGMGQRVVIVCCDLRRPRIHEFFGLDNSVGLTSVLLGQEPLTVALQSVADQPHLSVLASGPLPPNPADLLSSPRTTEALEALQAHADIVLIDSPPVLPVTDSLILSARVDATLLTCLAGVTTRKELTRAAELLRQVDAPLVGTILNGVSEGEPSGYYYRYYGPSSTTAVAPPATPGNGNGDAGSRRGAKASRHQN
jgi:capsular exopolysaccharide synthesis family protein